MTTKIYNFFCIPLSDVMLESLSHLTVDSVQVYFQQMEGVFLLVFIANKHTFAPNSMILLMILNAVWKMGKCITSFDAT